MIDFNRAPYLGTEVEYMQQAIANACLLYTSDAADE